MAFSAEEDMSRAGGEGRGSLTGSTRSYLLARWLFVRALGLTYLFAFASLAAQVKGLIGENGILPAKVLLAQASLRFGESAFLALPSIFWLDASDGALVAAARLGAVVALLVVVGVLARPLLCLLWLLYLSFVTVGSEFMSFQWDSLLLESGVLGVFAASGRLLSPPFPLPRTWAGEPPPCPAVIWLCRWLAFRVIFLSGLVKLASGDPCWRTLTALTFHWHTQPLPTPLAWYVDALPVECQKAMCAGVFLLELAVPLTFFFPRPLRLWGAGLSICLQLAIAATGNYTFFNFLTCALCLWLIDDGAMARLMPRRLLAGLAECSQGVRRSLAERLVIACLSFAVIGSTAPALGLLPGVGGLFAGMSALAEQYRLVSSYGVFAVMTTRRMEIIVEGSNDGSTWLAYEFKYKPGALDRAPPMVAPHQPRLDWQMWFAALSEPENCPWFAVFVLRLLQGNADVLALLDKNPFPGRPPRFVRATAWDYTFTTFQQRAASGAYWQRVYRGIYFPATAL